MKEINKLYRYLGLPVEEITRRNGITYLRKRPEWKDDITKAPTSKLIHAIKFGKVMKKVEGKKGFDTETGLPHGASAIMKEMSGNTLPNEVKKRRIPLWVQELEKLPPEKRELLKQIFEKRAPEQHSSVEDIVERLVESASIPRRIRVLRYGSSYRSL
jgi:hypothetical protein